MSETAEATTAAEKPKVASIGQVQRVNNFTAPAKQPEAEATQNNADATSDTNTNADATADQNADANANADQNAKNSPIAKPLSEYTKEEIEARFKELNPDKVDLTPEQLVQKEKERDEKRLAIYLRGGGTIEQYAQIKQVKDMDLTELSKAELTRELKAKNFDDAAIAEIQKERYYQLNPDELEPEGDEDDEAFEARKAKLKQKVEFGTEKLNNRSAHLKNNAKLILDNLDKAIDAEDLQKQDEQKFIAKIDEYSKTMPRKLNIPLGKLNNDDLGTVDLEVPEATIAEITAQLKDKQAINKILYTEEGDLNHTRISELLLKEKLFDSGTREGFLSGRNDQIAKFEKVFPSRTASALGVGGSVNPNGSAGKGKVASFGKAQPIGKPSGK